MKPLTRESHVYHSGKPVWRKISPFGWLVVFIGAVCMGGFGLFAAWALPFVVDVLRRTA